MPILYFFGPDGAGKSTLTKRLAKDLCDQGYKVKNSWMRGSHTFTSIFAKFLSRFTLFKGSANPYYNIVIPDPLKRFWQFIEFLSAIPVIFTRFLFPNLLGYWVLADRYALDLAVWLRLTTDDPDLFKKFEAKLLIALSVKTDAKFYVTASYDDLLVRTDKLWLPKEQLHLYSLLAKSIGAHVINSSVNSVDDSLREIESVIKNNYL